MERRGDLKVKTIKVKPRGTSILTEHEIVNF